MGNPLKYTDPNGDSVFVDDYGEITRETDDDHDGIYMNSEDGLINIGEKGGVIDITQIYQNILNRNIDIAKSLSSLSFASKVSPGGDWDYKESKTSILSYKTSTSNGKFATFIFNGLNMGESQDVGNHHFGVTGSANGFSAGDFLFGAGIVQILQGNSKSDWINPILIQGGVNGYPTMILTSPFGDDPRDQNKIMNGIKYFEGIK